MLTAWSGRMGEGRVDSCDTLSVMPRPLNERQALEEERKELDEHLARFTSELEATPDTDKANRERLTWQIRRAQLRMKTVEARMAAAE